MFSYYNLVVSDAQADRSETVGYRVPSGAKAEFSADAIRRDFSQGRTARHGGFVHRLALLLAASAAFLLAGIPGASAREQSDMFADADGIEPPDMGLAYDRNAAYKDYAQWQRQQRKRIAAHSDSGSNGRQKISHHETGRNQNT